MTESRFSKKRTLESPRLKRGDKRARILDAAARVFVDNGFNETHVSHIAKAAGVADGTIYLYFQSKEALLVALFEDNVGRFFATLDRELSVLATPRAKLRRIVELQLGLLDRERGLAELLTVNLRQSSPSMRAHMVPYFNAYLERIAAVVAEGQQTGELRGDIPPRIAARAVFGALDGITLTWALGRGDEGGLVKAAELVSRLLLEGLMTR